MNLDMRVIDYIKDRANIIETPEGTLTASQMLEKFLFPSALQYTTIGRLSGGERRRLYLLRILMDAPNVLLLDEPTNDLDIQTLGILEDYLDTFPGAVIAVSHDRYFLDRVADHLFVFEDGILSRRIGGYSEYLQERRAILRQKEKAAKAPKAENNQQNRNAPAPKLKFTFKEQKEYETIDEVIASLEEKIADTEDEIGRTVSDFIRLQELTQQKEKLETELAEKMERWVYLTELAEKIEAQGKR
jgi:ATP-binding cassette subfamily F protein uup